MLLIADSLIKLVAVCQEPARKKSAGAFNQLLHIVRRLLQSSTTARLLLSEIKDCLSLCTEELIFPSYTHKYLEDLVDTTTTIAESQQCRSILQTLRLALSGNQNFNSVHIHVIGDGKAGKSVAVKWIKDLLISKVNENAARQSKYDQIFSVDVRKGRTRGVETTSIIYTDIYYRHTNLIIHDYGGQEEFLANHASFLSAEHSIYVLVVPLVDIGDSLANVRLRTKQEIIERYLFWLRFIFSVVKKDSHRKEAGSAAGSSTDWVDELFHINTVVEESDESRSGAMGSTGGSSKKKEKLGLSQLESKGIPFITVINQFSSVLRGNNIGVGGSIEWLNSYVQEIKSLLTKELLDHYTLSASDWTTMSESDFLAVSHLQQQHQHQQEQNPFYYTTFNVPPSNQHVNSSTPSPVIAIDNISNRQVLQLTECLTSFLDHSKVRSNFNLASVITHTMDCLVMADLPIFLSLQDWNTWLFESITTFATVSSTTAAFAAANRSRSTSLSFDGTSSQKVFQAFESLTAENKNGLIYILATYIQDYLIKLNKIIVLPEAIHSYQVVTNPASLSTAILGDLLWWFVVYHPQDSDRFHTETLQVTQEGILSRLREIDAETKRSSSFAIVPGVCGSTPAVASIKDLLQVSRSNASLSQPNTGNNGSGTIDETIQRTGSQDGDYCNSVAAIVSPSIAAQRRTAMDYLSALSTDLSTFPLLKLLNSMGLGIEITDPVTGEMKTWLLGLAPDLPTTDAISDSRKGASKVSNSIDKDSKIDMKMIQQVVVKHFTFSFEPDHEIRRFYRLPDKRTCFVPGFFLRLFVYLVNIQKYQILHGYGNAVKVRKVIKIPTLPPNSQHHGLKRSMSSSGSNPLLGPPPSTSPSTLKTNSKKIIGSSAVSSVTSPMHSSLGFSSATSTVLVAKNLANQHNINHPPHHPLSSSVSVPNFHLHGLMASSSSSTTSQTQSPRVNPPAATVSTTGSRAYGGQVEVTIEMIIVQLSDEGEDDFVIAVATKAKEQGLDVAFQELTNIRSYLYNNSWGLQFEEFCLAISCIDISDIVVNNALSGSSQGHHATTSFTMKSIREDLMNHMVSLDEIEPRLFGIPSFMEEDYYHGDFYSHANSVHSKHQQGPTGWSRLRGGVDEGNEDSEDTGEDSGMDECSDDIGSVGSGSSLIQQPRSNVVSSHDQSSNVVRSHPHSHNTSPRHQLRKLSLGVGQRNNHSPAHGVGSPSNNYSPGIGRPLTRKQRERERRITEAIHHDCMAARRNAVELYFGKRPRYHTKSSGNTALLGKEADLQELISLERGKPTQAMIDQLLNHKRELSETASTCSSRMLMTLSISDIFQCYSETFYEDSLLHVIKQCKTREDVLIYAQQLPAEHEIARREILFRMLKAFFVTKDKDFSHEKLSLQDFDYFISQTADTWARPTLIPDDDKVDNAESGGSGATSTCPTPTARNNRASVRQGRRSTAGRGVGGSSATTPKAASKKTPRAINYVHTLNSVVNPSLSSVSSIEMATSSSMEDAISVVTQESRDHIRSRMHLLASSSIDSSSHGGGSTTKDVMTMSSCSGVSNSVEWLAMSDDQQRSWLLHSISTDGELTSSKDTQDILEREKGFGSIEEKKETPKGKGASVGIAMEEIHGVNHQQSKRVGTIHTNGLPN